LKSRAKRLQLSKETLCSLDLRGASRLSSRPGLPWRAIYNGLREVARDQDRRPRHPARRLPGRREAPRLRPGRAGLRQGRGLVEDRRHRRACGRHGEPAV